jgi:hypothetical protein
VKGTGLDTGASGSLKMSIDGVEQTLESVQSNEAKFILTGVNDKQTKNVVLISEDGYPEGYNTANQLYFGQKLYSVQPSIGSAGGTKLILSTAAIG